MALQSTVSLLKFVRIGSTLITLKLNAVKWNVVKIPTSFWFFSADSFQPTSVSLSPWGCMPECVDGNSAQTRDHVISFRCSAEDSLISRFWMGLDTWMHSCEAYCEQPHVLGDWFWILFAVKKGGAKPWWIAVVSGCDVGDGDFGSFSPTLCASAGLVLVWHCSLMTCCVWKGKWLSHVEPLQAELLKSQVLTCFCNTFQRVQSCCWCRSCRWTISSVPASSVLWPNRNWC